MHDVYKQSMKLVTGFLYFMYTIPFTISVLSTNNANCRVNNLSDMNLYHFIVYVMDKTSEEVFYLSGVSQQFPEND